MSGDPRSPSAAPVSASSLHPHEPKIAPVVDAEGRCLVCRLQLVAEAWFSFDQQALDALLNDYREDDCDA